MSRSIFSKPLEHTHPFMNFQLPLYLHGSGASRNCFGFHICLYLFILIEVFIRTLYSDMPGWGFESPSRLSPRYSRCGVPGVALKAPKGDANPRLMQGNKNEAMKSTDIKLHKSWTPFKYPYILFKIFSASLSTLYIYVSKNSSMNFLTSLHSLY